MWRVLLRFWALVAAALLCTPVAVAHHSVAMFNLQTQVSLKGVVKEFQWTNPHCWIQLMVMGADGPREWSIEMGSPAHVYEGGWKPRTLKAGDEIRIVVHPAHDGTRVGSFVSATAARGEALGGRT